MEQIISKQHLAKLAAFATCLLWASAFVVIRSAVKVYTPEDLALLRYFVASLVMCVLYFVRSRHNTVRLVDIPKIIGIGIIGIGIYNITLNIGETQLSSATAGFIINQVPMITTLLAFIFLKEKISLRHVAGLIISFSGVALIAINSMTHLHTGLSMLYVVIAALCGSIFSILQKPLLTRVDPFQLVAWAIWGATLAMFYWEPSTWRQLHTAPLSITLSIVFIGVFPAAIAYALWGYAIAYFPVNKAVTYLYALPLLVLVMGWVFLHDWPSSLSLLGGFIALLGIIVGQGTGFVRQI